MGNNGVKTMMINIHVLNQGGHGVQSPIDKLLSATED